MYDIYIRGGTAGWWLVTSMYVWTHAAGIGQIEDGEQLMPGSEMELEIRACTVAAVERLRDCLLERHRELMQTGKFACIAWLLVCIADKSMC